MCIFFQSCGKFKSPVDWLRLKSNLGECLASHSQTSGSISLFHYSVMSKPDLFSKTMAQNSQFHRSGSISRFHCSATNPAGNIRSSRKLQLDFQVVSTLLALLLNAASLILNNLKINYMMCPKVGNGLARFSTFIEWQGNKWTLE